MVKTIFACLVLALGLWACDDGGGRCNPEIKNIQDCPVEGILRRCNDFRCNGDQPLEDFRILAPNCEIVDCFSMDCEITNANVMSGIFIIDEFNVAAFTGVASVDGQEDLNYECNLTTP